MCKDKAKTAYVPPHRRGGAAGAPARGGAYVPPHMRRGGVMAPQPAQFNPNAPTVGSFLTGKGFKRDASGYYYPNPEVRPHIHVHVDSRGAPDFTSLTMVALSSKVSGAGGRDAGLTVVRNGKLDMNGRMKARVDERLGQCDVDTRQMFAEIIAAL